MQIQSTFRAKISGQAAGHAMADIVSALQPAAATFYPAESAIYAQGEAAGNLYYVEFGMVRICRVTADGRRQISAFHLAGEVFGFESGHEHESYAESVDGAGIRLLRGTAGSMSTGVLTLALNSLMRVQNHLMVLGRRTANERMAALLVDLMDRQGDEQMVRLVMPRNDIADYLGLTFETVSRVLRAFKDEGLIRMRNVHEVEILDRGQLVEMCD